MLKKSNFPRENTHIEGTQKEEGGLEAHREDEAEDGDDDESPDTQWLRHDKDDDEGRNNPHPQHRRQVGIQHNCGHMDTRGGEDEYIQ